MKLVIGSRGSKLALWQAHHVKARLEKSEPGLVVELVILKTKGDKILDVPLAKVGGKGLFVKEIEEALLRNEIDLAVHSMKDVPVDLTPGLAMVATSEREDARDALLSRSGANLDALPNGAHIGTSSLRRFVQLLARRPDLRITALRGNVDTRMRKLDDGDYDAIVLATAGLSRLGFADRISERLSVELCLPAIGQGALGLEAREGDADTIRRAQVMHDPDTAVCVTAERAFLTRLQGGCQTPIAAHATLSQGNIALDGLVGDPDATRLLREQTSGPADEADSLGTALADRLIEQGASDIIERAKREQTTVPY